MSEKQFENKWIEKLKGELKRFPSDFISFNEFETINNNSKLLTLGGEFFGNHEVIDTNGDIVAQTDDYLKAKFLIYASADKPEIIKVPLDTELIHRSVREYENYLDSLITQIKEDYFKNFPESKNFNKVSNSIFNILNLHRY